MTVKEEIEGAIRRYLTETFENEGVLPDVMISGLAEAIEKEKHQIYRTMDDEYMVDDIDMICEDTGVELSPKEASDALYRYWKIKENDDSITYLRSIIDDIVERRSTV